MRIETWAVDASSNEVSLDLANLLTGERRLKEHPDAFTAFAYWAHCVDGTGHEAVWRENEPAPRWRKITPGNRRWRTDQIPKGLRGRSLKQSSPFVGSVRLTAESGRQPVPERSRATWKRPYYDHESTLLSDADLRCDKSVAPQRPKASWNA